MGHFEFYPSTARCNIHFVCAQLILKFKGSNVIPGRQQSGWRVDNMDMVDIDMVDMDMVDMDMVDMDMVDMDREAILRNRSHRNFNFKRPYLETGRST